MSLLAGAGGRDLRDTDLEEPQLSARLAALWGTPPTLIGRLMSVDHKVIGRRYIVTAFAFLILGGVLALLMRLQLSGAERNFIGPDLYNVVGRAVASLFIGIHPPRVPTRLFAEVGEALEWARRTVAS